MKGRDLLTILVLDLLFTVIFIALIGSPKWGFFFFIILLFVFWIFFSRKSVEETDGAEELRRELGVDGRTAALLYSAGYRDLSDFDGVILEDLLMVEGMRREQAESVMRALKERISGKV
ncbi:MAG: hypothetical protein J7L88_01425 [Thermoplasmata archaeon]|nr:hypothetical protein [Thermoplasmata archaeon]